MPKSEENLTVLTIQVDRLNADGLQSWIYERCGVAAVQLGKPSSDRAFLEVYFEDEVEARLLGSALEEGQGLPVAYRNCPTEDWTTFWQHHFKPQAIGQRIWVCPVWEEASPPTDEYITLKVNPGLSFGTGDHFTTRFCLDVLDGICVGQAPTRILDAGSGSAIIGIAAALLGCSEVLGVEIDPVAVTHARENIGLNNVANQVRVEEFDLTERWVEGTYPVVFANLFSHLLIDLAPQLMRTAEETLVITGIRSIEADMVGDSFAQLGAKEIRRDADHEWCGMVLDVREG